MRFYLLIFGLLVSSAWNLADAGETPDSIRICTPEWENFTQKNGEGLFHELWQAIFPPAGVALDITYHPFKRCETVIKQHRSEHYDAYPGGYANASPTLITPHWHLSIDLISVAYRKGFIKHWEGQQQLEHQKVAWERGYNFDGHGLIKVKVELHEFNQLRSALQMLVAERIDFILDYHTALEEIAAELGIAEQVEIAVEVIHGPKYYLLFQATDRGRQLAAIWDAGMQRLAASGELQALYQKYQDPGYGGVVE